MPLHVAIGSLDDDGYVEYADLDNVIIRPGVWLTDASTTNAYIELVGLGAPEEDIKLEGRAVVVSAY